MLLLRRISFCEKKIIQKLGLIIVIIVKRFFFITFDAYFLFRDLSRQLGISTTSETDDSDSVVSFIYY